MEVERSRELVCTEGSILRKRVINWTLIYQISINFVQNWIQIFRCLEAHFGQIKHGLVACKLGKVHNYII
jgi:hypothetical protein